MYCKNCGGKIDDNTEICQKCRTRSPSQKIPSKWWYALVLFGIVGGIIGYIFLKNKDKSMAKNVLVIGIGISILTLIPNTNQQNVKQSEQKIDVTRADTSSSVNTVTPAKTAEKITEKTSNDAVIVDNEEIDALITILKDDETIIDAGIATRGTHAQIVIYVANTDAEEVQRVFTFTKSIVSKSLQKMGLKSMAITIYKGKQEIKSKYVDLKYEN